jgi:predicted nucleic acid-binding protein
MSSIRTEWVALDTNIFVFGIRGDSAHPDCERLLTDGLSHLRVFVPLQVIAEVHRNLTTPEVRTVYQVLDSALELTWDFAPADVALIRRSEHAGAKKGDAVIAAHLQRANVPWLVSENRHFLAENPNLGFSVATAGAVLEMLNI